MKYFKKLKKVFKNIYSYILNTQGKISLKWLKHMSVRCFGFHLEKIIPPPLPENILSPPMLATEATSPEPSCKIK
jgi:hypothetical protein